MAEEAGLEAEPRRALPEKPLRELVERIGHGKAEFSREADGTFKIESEESGGILGLGFDGREVWLCPTQSFEVFQRHNGWNANDRMPLYSDNLDSRIKEDLNIEIARTETGETEYRFSKKHWLTRFLGDLQEEGHPLSVTLHSAQEEDWSDHQAAPLVMREEALVAGPLKGSGYTEMKLSVGDLNVSEWHDGGWVKGVKQVMKLKPAS